MEFTRDRPPASADELDAAERELAQLGHRIPPSYKAFLAVQDGGKPSRSTFRFEQDGRDQDDVVEEFLGVAPVPAPDLNLVRTARLLGSRIPAGVLPIADDPFGNHICIDGRDGRDGPVLFWDHEYEGDPPDEANLYEIAPDLHTFLDALTEEPQASSAAPQPKPHGLRRLFKR
jgi:cell wall assembly regulator SMI1